MATSWHISITWETLEKPPTYTSLKDCQPTKQITFRHRGRSMSIISELSDWIYLPDPSAETFLFGLISEDFPWQSPMTFFRFFFLMGMFSTHEFSKILEIFDSDLGFYRYLHLSTLCFCDSAADSTLSIHRHPGPITQSGPAEVPKHRKRWDPGSSSCRPSWGVCWGELGEHSEDDRKSAFKRPRFKQQAFEFLHFNPQENRGINTATDLANGTLK